MKDHLDHSELAEATQAYKKLLFDWYANHFSNDLDNENLESEYGTAISTFGAASCIEDGFRTRQFIRGISKSFDSKLKHHSSIHVLYAGTGPFANLLLPLFQEYSQFDIHYTLIEINPVSFTILNRFLEDFNKSSLPIKTILADASKVKIPIDQQPDILISETMQAGLRAEPQVAILQNLIPQAKEDAYIIPQNIALSLGLYDKKISSKNIQKEDIYQEHPVFETNFITSEHPGTTFPTIHTHFQTKSLTKSRSIFLLTEIQVFEDERISFDQSGLTLPLKIMDLPDGQSTNFSISSNYQLKPHPELIIKMM